MSTSDFEKDADLTLQTLRASLDDSGIDAEIELQMGILSIELPDGTKYMLATECSKPATTVSC